MNLLSERVLGKEYKRKALHKAKKINYLARLYNCVESAAISIQKYQGDMRRATATGAAFGVATIVVGHGIEYLIKKA
jgi:hypothetical protein